MSDFSMARAAGNLDDVDDMDTADDEVADSDEEIVYEGLDTSDLEDDEEDEPGELGGRGEAVGSANAGEVDPATGAPASEVVAESSATESTKPPALVSTQLLRKEFIVGDEIIRAVDDVSLALSARQLVAVTGPSGCGKTTLLYLLGSLEQPTAGKIIIDGVDVGALSGRDADEFRRRKIGFVFQSYQLIPNLSALENVLLPMELAGSPRATRRDRAEHLLRQVGIEEKRFEHRPNKLSGGQQQRVAIARALANDPSVILADEPTGNLDSNNSRRLVNVLRTLAREGRTIIIVTHDRGIARLADLRIDLVDGRVARMSTPAEAARAAATAVAEPERKHGAGRDSARGKRRR